MTDSLIEPIEVERDLNRLAEVYNFCLHGKKHAFSKFWSLPILLWTLFWGYLLCTSLFHFGSGMIQHWGEVLRWFMDDYYIDHSSTTGVFLLLGIVLSVMALLFTGEELIKIVKSSLPNWSKARSRDEQRVVENRLMRITGRAVMAAVVVNDRIQEWNNYLALLALGDCDRIEDHDAVEALILRARESACQELGRAKAHLDLHVRRNEDPMYLKLIKPFSLYRSEHRTPIRAEDATLDATLHELSDASRELVHRHRADLEIDPDAMLDRALADHHMAQLEEELNEVRARVQHPPRVTN